MMVIGRELKVEFEAISRYLAPRRFIERRTAVGAPSPATMRTYIQHRKQDMIERDQRAELRAARINEAIIGIRKSAAEVADDVQSTVQ